MMDILIVGGGPTGLTAAVEAKRQGLTARIIERKSETNDTKQSDCGSFSHHGTHVYLFGWHSY
jgi:2-polyprenyl-6-methoxyphenol hydroxylase-like FAD-dependent oxidoreductase